MCVPVLGLRSVVDHSEVLAAIVEAIPVQVIALPRITDWKT
jgi:hypothetical protein